jgi:hypothetical protein
MPSNRATTRQNHTETKPTHNTANYLFISKYVSYCPWFNTNIIPWGTCDDGNSKLVHGTCENGNKNTYTGLTEGDQFLTISELPVKPQMELYSCKYSYYVWRVKRDHLRVYLTTNFWDVMLYGVMASNILEELPISIFTVAE